MVVRDAMSFDKVWCVYVQVCKREEEERTIGRGGWLAEGREV